MAMSTANPPKKPAKRGTKVLQMEPQTPFDSPQTPPETDDSPPVEARPPVSSGSTNPKPFPIPPKPSLKGGYCEEAVGMAYWRGIPEEFRDRLTVYINREHPVLNRMVEVTPEDIELMRQHKKRYPIKYIDLPPEPFSEDTAGEFLNRYGSGKYKVFVNDVGIKGAKAPDLQSRNLCKFMVKVYDSDHPPILDPSRPDKGLGVLDWTHPENQSYVAELRTRGIFPPDEKAGDSVAESVVTTLVDKISDLSDRVGVHETDRLVERIAEKMNGGQSRAGETLDTIRAVKEMMTPTGQPAAVAKDPLELATALFTIMNQTKADNPAIDMYRDELKAAREEMKEMRAAALAQATSPSTQSKSLVDQAVELAGAVEKLSPLKALFGLGGNGAVAETVRAGRTGWLDVARDLGSKFFESDLATGVGQYLGSIAMRNAGGPMQPNPAPNGQPQVQQRDEAAAFDAFVREVVNPTLLRQYSRGFGGDDFAGWMFDAFPDRLKQLQTLTHQRMPGQKGAPVIIAAYQNLYPDTYKPLIAQREGETSFAQFVNEFCAWKPEEEQQEPIDAIPVEPDGEETPERI
jgi:hypothetical protein